MTYTGFVALPWKNDERVYEKTNPPWVTGDKCQGVTHFVRSGRADGTGTVRVRRRSLHTSVHDLDRVAATDFTFLGFTIGTFEVFVAHKLATSNVSAVRGQTDVARLRRPTASRRVEFTRMTRKTATTTAHSERARYSPVADQTVLKNVTAFTLFDAGQRIRRLIEVVDGLAESAQPVVRRVRRVRRVFLTDEATNEIEVDVVLKYAPMDLATALRFRKVINFHVLICNE